MGQILTTWAIGLSHQIISRRGLQDGPHNNAGSFFRSKHKIGSSESDSTNISLTRLILILMLIRLKASDFGHTDFSSKNNRRSSKSKQASCTKSDPEMVLESCDCCDRAVRSQKIQDNVDYCCVWRREETRRLHFSRPHTQASEPALASKRCARALEVTVFSKHPSPAR